MVVSFPSVLSTKNLAVVLVVSMISVLILAGWNYIASSRISEDALRQMRDRMVAWQIERRGVKNPRVLEAMRKVERHKFVPSSQVSHAYEDRRLHTGKEQKISQPYIVALMTELADPQPTDKVLEVGTGSGYQAAVLAELCQEVYTMEIIESLAGRAADLFKSLGYEKIQVRAGDGYKGWPEKAPFDKILVTAAPPEIPKALLGQLKRGGRLVIPVGTVDQELMLITKDKDGKIQKEQIIPVRFVPMVEGEDKE